jgi:hypothetical protein
LATRKRFIAINIGCYFRWLRYGFFFAPLLTAKIKWSIQVTDPQLCLGLDAQNRFTEAVEAILTRKQFEAYDSFCLKATTDEIIEEGLRLAKAATEQKEH